MMKKITAVTALAMIAVPAVSAAQAQAATKTYALSGVLWNDVNKNNVINSNELKSANFTIRINNSAGKTIKTIKTDKNGFYKTYLPVGTYTVAPALQSGYKINKSTKIYVSKNVSLNLPIVKVTPPAPSKPVTPKTTPTPVPVNTSAAKIEAFKTLVNAGRKARGSSPVVFSSCLTNIAVNDVNAWKKAGTVVNPRGSLNTAMKCDGGYFNTSNYYAESSFGKTAKEVYDISANIWTDNSVKGLGVNFDGPYVQVILGQK